MASRTFISTAVRSAAPRVALQASSRATLASTIRQSRKARSFTSASQLALKKFTEDHEWIELDSDGKIGTVGVTAYAAKALGDVVFVELPATETAVSAGDSIGAVESVKSASDILTPVSGTVIEVNSVLEEKPGTINKSPMEEGWIAKLEISDVSELDALMDESAYDKHIDETGGDH